MCISQSSALPATATTLLPQKVLLPTSQKSYQFTGQILNLLGLTLSLVINEFQLDKNIHMGLDHQYGLKKRSEITNYQLIVSQVWKLLLAGLHVQEQYTLVPSLWTASCAEVTKLTKTEATFFTGSKYRHIWTIMAIFVVVNL